jgi:N-dimethylarginine dimethylaminohydrolase
MKTKDYSMKVSSFLVCAPDFYEITRPSSPMGPVNAYAQAGYNFFMTDPVVFKDEAKRQWYNLIEEFAKACVPFERIHSMPGLPYQVFTADASLSFTDKNGAPCSILSNFK